MLGFYANKDLYQVKTGSRSDNTGWLPVFALKQNYYHKRYHKWLQSTTPPALNLIAGLAF